MGSLGSQPEVKIEPPSWWIGMENPNLQLMVYYEGISKYELTSENSHLEIKALHRTSNPNYIFIDLYLHDELEAGTHCITAESDDYTLTIKYNIDEREEGSKDRTSFDGSDVMYLVTPDRFANGNPSNDNILGYVDTLNREHDYGRHGGDLQGLIDHLDYIDDMGFTALWLNPILENNQISSSYHGYATTDYYRVDPRFGTNETYRELSKKAKERGIGIIMDIIVNHCGSQHWWMKDPPMEDWLNYQDEEYKQTNHRKETLLDPYGSTGDREAMVKGWFARYMPDLNQRNPFVSTYLIQNSIWWIEYADLYGIRQDTYSYPYREFMTDWTCAIQKEYPNFKIVGEEWVNDPAMISYWQEAKVNADGYTSCLSSLMDFPLCFAVRDGFLQEKGWSDGIAKLYLTLSQDYHMLIQHNSSSFLTITT